MPIISTDYVWEVRHRVGERLWVYSEKYEAVYDKQTCETKHCYGRSVIEISIFEDGRVEAGWRGVKNPKYVFLKGDRAIPLNPDSRYDLPWGNDPLFEIIR